MSQDFQPGDFLIFQLESGYGLLRLLYIEDADDGRIWHLSAYEDLFPDTESVEAAIEDPEKLTIEISHLALTNRAFESTQVARIGNIPLEDGIRPDNESIDVSDRSIRLLLGLR